MKRILSISILGLAAVGATVALATPAMAATYDDARVGTITKSDVMQPLGLNEAKFQAAMKADPNALKVTDVFKTFKDTSWSCTDGFVKHHIFTTTTTRPVDVTTIFNTSSNKVTGWTMNGLSTTDYGTTTGVTTGDDGTGRFATYSCAGHGSTVYSTINVSQTHSIEPLTATFNGSAVSIPNTPIEVAPVA